MSSAAQIFRIETRLGPEKVFQALRKVTEHPQQRRFSPEFEFDWLKRRVEISADSREGVGECSRQFLAQIRKHAGSSGEDLLLPGPIEETEAGRFVQPFGLTLQEPMVFAELIGQTLVEMGFSNVKITEEAGVACLSVRPGPLAARQIDYRTLVLEFPVPDYIRIQEET